MVFSPLVKWNSSGFLQQQHNTVLKELKRNLSLVFAGHAGGPSFSLTCWLSKKAICPSAGRWGLNKRKTLLSWLISRSVSEAKVDRKWHKWLHGIPGVSDRIKLQRPSFAHSQFHPLIQSKARSSDYIIPHLSLQRTLQSNVFKVCNGWCTSGL